MKWKAIPTGDMTLSVMDESGVQILKIDMLAYSTMKAETHGERLFKAMNDLQIVANFSEGIYDIPPKNGRYKSRHDYSELPWTYEYSEKKHRLILKNAAGKKICEKDYPKSIGDEMIREILSIVDQGIQHINMMKG